MIKIVDAQSIGISSLITLGLVTLAMLSPQFFETQKYYCEAEGSIMECAGGISDGQHTRCYLTKEKDSWDYCSSGWIPITDDRPIQDNGTTPPKPIMTEEVWLCSVEGCIPI